MLNDGVHRSLVNTTLVFTVASLVVKAPLSTSLTPFPVRLRSDENGNKSIHSLFCIHFY